MFFALVALGALGGLLAIHLLGSGRQAPLTVGTVRFVPPAAARRRSLSRLRQALLFVLRAALLVTAIAWCRVLLSSEQPLLGATAPPRADTLRSRLAGAGDDDPAAVASPALAVLNHRDASPARVVLADSAREGAALAPARSPDAFEWQLVPPASSARPVTVALLSARDRAAEHRRVRAALEALDPRLGLELAYACLEPACVPDRVTDLALVLGSVDAPMPAERVVRDASSAPTRPAVLLDGGTPRKLLLSEPPASAVVVRRSSDGEPLLVRRPDGPWELTLRFTAEAFELVEARSFPAWLAELLGDLGPSGEHRSASARAPEQPFPGPFLAVLLAALWVVERAVSVGRIGRVHGRRP